MMVSRTFLLRVNPAEKKPRPGVMTMTRAAAARAHAVFPESISIGTTHNLPLCLCDNLSRVQGRLCYARVTRALSNCYAGPRPTHRPEQWSRGAIEPDRIACHSEREPRP